MKKIIAASLILTGLWSCKKDKTEVAAPSDIQSATATARVGGALVKFVAPSDSNYDFVQVMYDRQNGSKRSVNVSKYSDSVLINGLLNKYDYVFTVRTVRSNGESTKYGKDVLTNAVKPIRRSPDTAWDASRLTKVITTDAMLQTFTQETTEGPKSALVDGNINTFWHTAWSSGVQPLPHWIMVDYGTPQSIGVIKYNFRQSASTAGRPTQVAFETSTNGTTWTRVFTSAANLPVANTAQEQVITLPRNYTSRYFRFVILAASGTTTYTHLGEISFHSMGFNIVDKEAEAETNYNYPWF